jgi:hypothetical protein
MTALYMLVQWIQRQPMNFWALLAIFVGSLGVLRYVGERFSEVGAPRIRGQSTSRRNGRK